MVQTRHHGDLGPDLGIISSSGVPAARAVYDNDDNNDNCLHLRREEESWDAEKCDAC